MNNVHSMVDSLTRRECYERAARLQVAGQSIYLSLVTRAIYQCQAYALLEAGRMK